MLPAFLSPIPLPHIILPRNASSTVPLFPKLCTPSPPRIRTPATRAQDFITQRAVQHTMFCARVLRDETTTNWLQEFLGHSGLDDLHHCDALHCDSEQYLIKLFKEPPVTLQIKKPIPGRTNSTNPYLKRRYLTYDVDIVPRKLALRVLEGRKQIAEELLNDIPFLTRENARLLELHRQQILNPDPTSLLSDILNYPSSAGTRGSPYRAANFDLVKNYTLYLSMVTVVKELFEEEQREREGDWLAEVLMTHGRELISPGSWGRADEVIERLLGEGATVGTGGVFDPGEIAERVLEGRERVASIWKVVMEGVEREQMDLQRRLLEDDL